MSCECLKVLVDNGYLHPNLLSGNTYFIYPVSKGKQVVNKPLLVRFCPSCGKEIKDGD